VTEPNPLLGTSGRRRNAALPPAEARRIGRRLISSGGPWEHAAGYSRAVVVGDGCWVSGTTDAGPDGRSRHPGDAAAQARACLQIIDAALTKAGFSLADVVRTRMYVTDIAHGPGVIAVHGEVFGEIRPAATLVAVAGLIDDSLLVEIEAEAHRA
jgi:enamine deaminase RidA (YjgF/YER057c/UK114 family)